MLPFDAYLSCTTSEQTGRLSHKMLRLWMQLFATICITKGCAFLLSFADFAVKNHVFLISFS